MNTKILILILLGGAGISTIGILSNDIDVKVQSFEVFDSVSTFTEGFECACEDPNGSGTFSMDFCDVTYLVPPDPNDPNDPGVPNPNSLGVVGNQLCTWEASEGEYGGGLNQEDEGCSARFWEQTSDPSIINQYAWPPGYNPDDKYTDIFFIDFYLDPAGGIYAVGKKNFDSEGNEILEFKKGLDKIKELIKNSMQDGKIKRSTAYSLLWLLDTSLDYDKRGHSDKAIKKFGDFIKKVHDDKVLDQDDDKYVKNVKQKIEKGIAYFKKNYITLHYWMLYQTNIQTQ